MQMIERFMKTQYFQLEPREALQHPPDVLLGVSHEAREQLKKLEVRSVFDLALSGIFANANKLLRSMEDPTDALTRYGTAPSDIIDQTVQIEEAASLPTMDIQVLAGIGPINGPLIAEALDVVTVRDLALWPPYLAAQAIFQEAFSPEQAPGYDSESPPDLLPKSGVYPTERVFYSTIVLDEIIDDVSKLSPLESAGPIDISPSINADFGFKKPAIGAVLTFSQTWFTQGVTLGQLLHSVALAPGESTRIAMIDWSRRSGVSVDESIQETEALSNTTGHNRSISEVTQAVAREAQSGFSNTSADSFSIEAGVAAGGLFGPVLVGASVGTAYSTSNASSFSSSSGRRDLSASMSQNIMDNTQQYANSARNRRASVIKEVSQSESEKVTTRVVTNYNHMHALSVQYYEVVQLYRVVVQLSEVEKCLFIPMKLINFRNTAMIAKYRHVLAAYALSGRIRRLLEPDPDTITLRAATVTGSIIGSTGTLPPRPPSRGEGGSDDAGPSKPQPPPGTPRGGFTGKWHMDQLEQLSLKIGRNILDPSGVLKLPAEMQLAGLRYRTSLIMLERLEIIRRSTGSVILPLNTSEQEYEMFQEPIPLLDIVSLDILNKPKTEDVHVDITLKLIYKGELVYLDVPFFIPMQPAESTVAEFSSSQIGEGEIADHLMINQLHYSQALWRNLDAATLALLLSPYKYSNKPVTQIIDPVPITIAGNFAVFRIHADPVTDISWAKWLKEHGIDRSIVKQEIVPLPSGGVFAEAVLGRYNSAEKLDMTRFWNWQDSPIPHEAPAIAPIQTGSRSEPDDTKPGNFSQPLVNIVNPTSLPDPQGMGAVLQSISNGNMFRDMSGLAATIGLAQAGLNATSAAAGRAASQAGANMATFAEFQVEMVKTLLPLIGAAMGVPISPNTSPSNISNDGAKINQGAKMDQKKTPASGGTGSEGTGAPSGGPTGGTGKGGTTGSTSPAPVPALGSSNSYEADAFQSSLGGSGGTAMLGLLSGILQTILSATPPAGSTTETKPELKLGDKVPNKSESDAVGAIDKKVKRNTPEFEALVKNENSDIVFKDEEDTDADRMMTPRMKEKLDALAELVKKEWPELKLRVTEVWDEDNEHSNESTHYEGRGADLTISDRDGKKLGRLAQLAVDAGFDWVFYEDSSHVHASVKKEDAE